MKKKCLLILSVISFHGVDASEITEFREQFKQCVVRCEASLASNKKVDKNLSFTKYSSDISSFSCHQKAISEVMFQQPEKRELILIAILKMSPENITETIKSVIDFGMAPMVAMSRAIEVFPEHSEQIAEGAIKAGVDSIVVMEATSTIIYP